MDHLFGQFDHVLVSLTKLVIMGLSWPWMLNKIQQLKYREVLSNLVCVANWNYTVDSIQGLARMEKQGVQKKNWTWKIPRSTNFGVLINYAESKYWHCKNNANDLFLYDRKFEKAYFKNNSRNLPSKSLESGINTEKFWDKYRKKMILCVKGSLLAICQKSDKDGQPNSWWPP